MIEDTAENSNEPYLEESKYYSSLWNSERWGRSDLNPDETARWDAIRRLLPEKERQRILDVGCGRGWLTNELAKFGDCLGIDPVEAGIARANELYPHISFAAKSTTDLLREIGPESYDVIVSSEVIEHIPYAGQQLFLNDIHALCKRGGTLIITTPRKEMWNSFHRYHKASQPIEDWLTENQLLQLGTSAGFKTCILDRIFLPGLPLGGILAKLLTGNLTVKYPTVLRMPLIERLTHIYSIYQIAAFKKSL